MEILAITNRKGGVGKTTTAAALADCLADMDMNVLLVDLDSQQSLSQLTGAAGDGMAAAMLDDGPPLADIVQQWRPGVWVAPAGDGLEDTAKNLAGEIGAEQILSGILHGLKFDVCIVDCSPSLDILTVNALAAADGLILPVRAGILDLMGLSKQLATVDKVRVRLNRQLEIVGVLITHYDGRRVIDRQAAEHIGAAGLAVFDARIPATVAISESPSTNQSIIGYAPASKAAAAYRKFTNEVNIWLRKKSK